MHDAPALEDAGAIPTDCNFAVLPTRTFAECPEHLDILLVPGGFGSNAAMGDDESIPFLKSRGAHARYVTSVCSGSTVLRAAGLLDGFKSATHWGLLSVLDAMHIETARERIVKDRNRISGGGITAGIDFGLTLLADMCGVDVAKRTRLLLEYDPQSPFNAGHPRTAEVRITNEVLTFFNRLFLSVGATNAAGSDHQSRTIVCHSRDVTNRSLIRLRMLTGSQETDLR